MFKKIQSFFIGGPNGGGSCCHKKEVQSAGVVVATVVPNEILVAIATALALEERGKDEECVVTWERHVGHDSSWAISGRMEAQAAHRLPLPPRARAEVRRQI